VLLHGGEAGAEPGPVPRLLVEDFEGPEWHWEGAARDDAQAAEGNASARWELPAQPTASSFRVPEDWSPFDNLRFRARVRGAASVEIHVVAECDDPDTDSRDYFYRAVTLVPGDWQSVRMPLESFEGSGQPLGWEHVDRLLFSTEWGLGPTPTATVYLDQVLLTRDSLKVDDEGWEQGNQGAVWHRAWKVQNRASGSMHLTATPEGDVPAGLRVGQVECPGADLPPGQGLRIRLPVRVAGEPGAAATRRALLAAALSGDAEGFSLIVTAQPTQVDGAETPAEREDYRLPAYLGSLYYQTHRPEKHPWVWFTEAEKRRLKALTDEPIARAAWVENRTCADNAVRWWEQAREAPRATPTFGPLRLVDVLNLAAVSDEQPYTDVARGLLLRFASREDWVSHRHKPRIVDLTSATQAMALGMGYDALWDRITEGERVWVRKPLLEKAILPYLTVLDHRRFPTADYRNNWCSVVTANIGVAVASLLGDDPRAAVWFHRVVREYFAILDHLPSDGGWSEGLSYWEYAVDSLLVFAEVVRRVTGGEVDALQNPFWAKTGDFVLHNYLPPEGWVNFCDAQRAPSNRAVLLKLGQELHRPDWNWLATRMPFRGQPKELLLWPENANGERPSAGAPRAAAFPEVGWVSMRSGWDDDAVVLALRSGYKDPHSHLDLNTFVLHAFGETLLRDLPIGHYPAGYFGKGGKSAQYWSSTPGHNTIVVDGRSQRDDLVSRAYLREFLYGGPGDDLRGVSSAAPAAAPEPGVGCDYALSDAREVYPDKISKALRHVLYVRGAAGAAGRADPGYFVIVDELAADAATDFDWRAHSGGQVRLGEEYLSVVADSGALAIFPLLPTGWRADEGQYADDARFIRIAPPRSTTSVLFVTLLVPVRHVATREGGGTGARPIPRTSLPEVVTLPREDGLDFYVRRAGHTDSVTVRTHAEGPAAVTLVTQSAGGQVMRAGLFGAREARLGPRQLVGSPEPVVATLWVDGDAVRGRVSGQAGPLTLDLALGIAPTSTVPSGDWNGKEKTFRLAVPAGSKAVPVRLEGCGGLG